MRRQRNESMENNSEDDFASEETRRHFARREQERHKDEDRRHSTREPHWEGDYGNLTGRNLKNNKRSDERKR